MRFPISARLTSMLVAVAALSLGLAFFVQDRFLREDLEPGARRGLEVLAQEAVLHEEGEAQGE